MRINQTITVAAGTPFCVGTQDTVGPAKNSAPRWAKRVHAQMVHGGTGLGYVMDGIAYGRQPAATNASDLTREMAPATATAPGGEYDDYDTRPNGGIDVNQIWVDGSHTGDKILVNYDPMV